MLSTEDKLFILEKAIEVSRESKVNYRDIYREMVDLMWEYDREGVHAE